MLQPPKEKTEVKEQRYEGKRLKKGWVVANKKK
jgi:hypothetical protein